MIEYTLRHNLRAKRITVRVRRDGSVWVTKPRRASIHEIEQFVKESESWISDVRTRFSKLPQVSRIESSKKEYSRYKNAAKKLAFERLKHFSQLYNIAYRDLSIRNQKSRWGSCSRAGNISLNYRLLFLPPELVDYLIVHELCHVQQLNHSKRFWALVAKAIPEYELRRKELRSYERGLLLD